MQSLSFEIYSYLYIAIPSFALPRVPGPALVRSTVFQAAEAVLQVRIVHVHPVYQLGG